MSDESIELEPGRRRERAITKNLLMKEMEMEDLTHRSKRASGANVVPDDIVPVSPTLDKDEAVLAGFGKKQQLKRRFKRLSSVSLTCGLMVTWLAILNTLQIGLANGGPAGMIWGFVGAFFCAMLQALVMAELASMIPLAGGAFNWVAVLSPPSCRKFLSYLAGWWTVIYYQCFVLSVCYGSASVIQGLVIITIPTYEAQLWHATLISYAVVLFGFFINTYLGRVLPQIESFMLIFFVLGYFSIMIPILYLGEHRSAYDVFTTFQSVNGWENNGVAFLVGWIASVGNFIGADAPDHIAEEIESAVKVIPFTMWFSTLFSGLLAFGMMLAAFFVTPDFNAAAHPETGFAFIDIFQAALGSTSGATALAAITVVVNTLSISSVVATASRALWAFARENGLPFSHQLTKIDAKTRLPYRAICVTVGVEVVLGLISIGSTTAFTAFYSVVLAAYQTGFLIPACVMLHKRLTTPDDQIPWGPFRLGRWGVPITVISIIYTVVTLIFSFFPSTLPVTASNMNYSVLIYGAALILMLGFWVLHGRKVYTGPIWEFEQAYVRQF